jgi:hypothetical protein
MLQIYNSLIGRSDMKTFVKCQSNTCQLKTSRNFSVHIFFLLDKLYKNKRGCLA